MDKITEHPGDAIYMQKYSFWCGVRNDPEDRIDPHCDEDRI